MRPENGGLTFTIAGYQSSGIGSLLMSQILLFSVSLW